MKYLLNVADLVVQIDVKYQLLLNRIQAYRIDESDHVDIVIDISEEKLKEGLEAMPNLSLEEVEYMLTSVVFFRELLNFNALVIHSSAVVVDNKVYAFSARSGVGKSTHANLYLERYKNSYIINDDKPVFRYIDGKFKVFGTPWSGKFDISRNIGVDLQGLGFIVRGKDNSIRSLNKKEAVTKIMEQTFIPNNREKLNNLLILLDKFINMYTLCEVTCDISIEACEMSYRYMKGMTNGN